MNYNSNSTCESRIRTLLVDVMIWRLMYHYQKLNQLIFLPEQLHLDFFSDVKCNC